MYKLTSPASVTRIADNASIPADAANTDYANYLAWVAAGNTPLPADVPSFAALKAAEFASFRATRRDFLDRMAGVRTEFSDMGVAGEAAVTNIQGIRQGLLGMLTEPAIADATEIVQLRAAMKARYKSLTSPAPVGTALPEVIAAYRKVDA